HLPIIGDVAPQEITALRVPGRAFGPQQSGMEALDRRVGLSEIIERRIDRDDIGIPEIGGRRAARAEIARRGGDRRRRRYFAAPRALTIEFVEPDQADSTSPVLLAKIFRLTCRANHF